jgi:hypothetical protein
MNGGIIVNDRKRIISQREFRILMNNEKEMLEDR